MFVIQKGTYYLKLLVSRSIDGRYSYL